MIITINGKYGCGSRLIAAKAAELLGYRLCDDEVVVETLKDVDVNMTEETFRYYDESIGTADIKDVKAQSKFDRNSQGMMSILSGLKNDVPPLDRALPDVMRKVVDHLAEEGNCIIFGRGTNTHLRGRPDAIHIFVTSELEKRVSFLRSLHPDISQTQAEKLINKTDKRRSDYCYFFSGERWDDPDNYDLVFKTELLGIDASAQMLKTLVELREAKLAQAES